ncbi:hypothetical protein CLCR_00523 [Cladophialophora carrionii]|uniref:Uncharacterized protein n=1 Tax=Cladophialophora carrionii TaxID=86049 RepID=A0A1C1CBT8_9EURO|nr:hypothetical protein CLCR_00523 [Cladophialophora carrionii]
MYDIAWAFLSGACGGVAVLFVAPFLKLEKALTCKLVKIFHISQHSGLVQDAKSTSKGSEASSCCCSCHGARNSKSTVSSTAAHKVKRWMDGCMRDTSKKHSIRKMVLNEIDEAFQTTGATSRFAPASLHVVTSATRLTRGKGTAPRRYGHGYALSLRTTSSLSM